jgi:hypothetical protein
MRNDRQERAAQPRESTTRPSSSGSGELGGFIGTLFHLIAWIVIGAIVLAILYLVGQAVVNFRWNRSLKPEPVPASVIDEKGELQPDKSPGELPADIYLDRARELANQGQYREALAQLILGAMSFVERAGLVQYRQGLTCRDYVRALRPHENYSNSLRSLVKIYEPIGFGRREASRESFLTSLAGYEAGFRRNGKNLET